MATLMNILINLEKVGWERCLSSVVKGGLVPNTLFFWEWSPR